MSKNSLIIIFLFFTGICQGQIVMSNGVKGVLNGGISGAAIYCVLNTPPATPIKTIGANNGLIMEAEFNILKYNLGILTTNITVPYMSSLLESFPLNLYAISGASGAGSIQFSTVKAPARASGWDNLAYKPTGVANMNGPLGTDNSAYVFDRFWIINPVGYATNPQVTMDFNFIAAEGAVNGGNTLNTNTILAQNYDDGLNSWNAMPQEGTNSGTGAVNAVSTFDLGTNFFNRVWTLVDPNTPLPITLSSFKGACLNGRVSLQWSTASESNSAYFSVEQSYDGVSYFKIGNVQAAGNSSSTLNYTFLSDSILSKPAYFKLKEVDLNGEANSFGPIAVKPCQVIEEHMDVVQAGGGNIKVLLYSLTSQNIRIKAFDASGRLVASNALFATQGFNEYDMNMYLSEGIYFYVLETETKVFSKKMALIQ